MAKRQESSVRRAFVEARSISPLLMHRNPGDQPSMAKPPKGKKTQAWIDAQHKSDWLRSAYWQEGSFHIPPEVIEGAIFEAAKKRRLGQEAKKAISVEELFVPLMVYKDDKDGQGTKANSGNLEDWYTPEHIDLRSVRVGPARVDRCRPIFRHWGFHCTIVFDEEMISPEQLEEIVGWSIVGDYRPRFGRLRVTKFEVR